MGPMSSSISSAESGVHSVSAPWPLPAPSVAGVCAEATPKLNNVNAATAASVAKRSVASILMAIVHSRSSGARLTLCPSIVSSTIPEAS